MVENKVSQGSKSINGQIRNELNYKELILASDESYVEDYQLVMLQQNELEGILNVRGCGTDTGSQYLYDISGMVSLKKIYERLIWDEEAIKKFLKKLLKVIEQVKNHMLDINCIILNPEYIYYKEEEYYFCYFPNLSVPLVESFHEWTEYLVKVVDYSNYDSVIWACGLHKESMEDGYNLEELLEGKMTATARDMKAETPHMVGRISEEPNALWKIEEKEEESYESKISAKKIKSNEHNNKNQSFIQGFFKQRKKQKWGEWDDLLSQEESSIMGKER